VTKELSEPKRIESARKGWIMPKLRTYVSWEQATWDVRLAYWPQCMDLTPGAHDVVREHLIRHKPSWTSTCLSEWQKEKLLRPRQMLPSDGCELPLEKLAEAATQPII
jgi:hypothetical protein